MQALHAVRRNLSPRVLIGLALVPTAPLLTAFLAPADALAVGVVAATVWVALLSRGSSPTRAARRVLLVGAAVTAVAWIAAFLLWDLR